MRFLADGMLGGLVRWLRMIGCDVEYDSSSNDDNLLTKAQRKNMILLTGDKELSKRAISQETACLLVKGHSERERLAEVASAFQLSLEIDMNRARCPECGGQLKRADKEKALSKVPEASRKLYNEFWVCTNLECDKTYWKGSHWGQIQKTLEVAKRLATL